MGDQAPTSTQFPTPPPFYKHFTKPNLTRLQHIRKEATQNQIADGTQTPRDHNASNADIDIFSLPSELRYLIPPQPPADGKWRTFGISHDLNAAELSLSDADVEQLFPNHQSVKQNPQPYMIVLARSLLTTFLSLVGILSQDPSLSEERVQELRTIVLNMHDLINQYRPHQARETLILMMEERIQRLRGEVKAIEESGEKVKEMLRGVEETGSVHAKAHTTEEEGVKRNDQAERRKAGQRTAWAILDSQLGEMNGT